MAWNKCKYSVKWRDTKQKGEKLLINNYNNFVAN